MFQVNHLIKYIKTIKDFRSLNIKISENGYEAETIFEKTRFLNHEKNLIDLLIKIILKNDLEEIKSE